MASWPDRFWDVVVVVIGGGVAFVVFMVHRLSITLNVAIASQVQESAASMYVSPHSSWFGRELFDRSWNIERTRQEKKLDSPS
jgi:hypothetical protein